MRYSILLLSFLIFACESAGKKSIEANRSNCSDNDINSDGSNDKYGNSALIYAATNGYGGCAAHLIENGADPNAPDRWGTTPMVAASINNMDHIVTLLVQKKADIETPNKNGLTPLMLAAQAGNLNATTALLNNNANINAVDRAGNTALIYSCSNSNSNLELVILLVENGADINVQGGLGTALAAAQKSNQPQKAKFLAKLLQEKIANSGGAAKTADAKK